MLICFSSHTVLYYGFGNFLFARPENVVKVYVVPEEKPIDNKKGRIFWPLQFISVLRPSG